MNNRITAIIVVLAIIAAFLAGSTFAKIKYLKDGEKLTQTTPTTSPAPTQVPFNPTKSDKPEIKFFVMSFCPYGNQAEAGIEPVYQLLKDKVIWTPRYIVNDKKSSCEEGCPNKIYNDQAKAQCDDAIKQGQLKDLEECKKYFPYTTADECLKKECAGLKAGEYDSLHGAQELTQDIREIVAYNEVLKNEKAGTEGILSKWWKFISQVNSKCSAQNADTCWTAEAKTAGLDTVKIGSLAISQKTMLLNKEIEEAQKYNASGSPTVYINDTLYSGGRAPEDYKKAICSAFNNPPEECKTVLGKETQGASGGCN